jgi:hypothetical protein
MSLARLLYNRRMSEADLHAALRTYFDLPAFRPGQEDASGDLLIVHSAGPYWQKFDEV